jgi:hypothetical protein
MHRRIIQIISKHGRLKITIGVVLAVATVVLTTTYLDEEE